LDFAFFSPVLKTGWDLTVKTDWDLGTGARGTTGGRIEFGITTNPGPSEVVQKTKQQKQFFFSSKKETKQFFTRI